MSGRQFSRREVIRGAAGLAAAALPVALGGCGGARATTAAVAAATGPPRRGGRLRAAFVGASTESTNVMMASLTAIDYVRARVVWDALGDLDGGRPTWRVAESVEPNATATEWTVRVRPGITFSTGKPLTAADVVFSVRTYLAQQTNQGALLGDIDPARIAMPDARTVVIPLHRPNGFLDQLLAQSMFIFPEGTKDFAQAPGSGPYTLVSFAPGRSSLLRRNPSYWAADHGGPYLDELELVSITDPNAMLDALKAGQIDYAGSVPLVAARAESANPAVQVQLSPKDLWTELAFAMNLGQAPFTDPRVVEAVKYAIDRPAMVAAATLGYGEVANDLLGLHRIGYDTSIPQRTYDPQRAAKLLNDAGHTGLQITLRTSDYEPGMLESAAAFVSQAAAAGIAVKLDKIPAVDYFSDPKALTSTPVQSIGYHSGPIAVQMVSAYGDSAPFPITGPTSPQLQALLDRLRRAVGEPAQAGTLDDLQHYLHDAGGNAVFARVPGASAATPQVHGVMALGSADYPSFRDAYLSA